MQAHTTYKHMGTHTAYIHTGTCTAYMPAGTYTAQMHTGTHTACVHVGTHCMCACMHTHFIHECRHTCLHTCAHTSIHTYPILGTKQQAEDLTARILFLERLLKSCRPSTHVIDKDTHCGPGRGETGLQLLCKGKGSESGWGGWGRLELKVAKPHAKEPHNQDSSFIAKCLFQGCLQTLLSSAGS